MISKIAWIGLLALSLLVSACNGRAGSNKPRAETPQVRAAPGSQPNTATEMLMKKAADTEARDLLQQDMVVDSARSAATDSLVYYWTRLAGRSFHEFQVFSIARYGGRYFDPGDLQAWSTIWSEWVPNSTDQALNVCLEAVAAGVANTPDRISNRDLLQVRTALRLVPPNDRTHVARADNAPVVERQSGASERWQVRFWYPDLDRRGRLGRLATRYLCEVPGTRSQHGLRVVEVDSIVRVL